MSPNIDWPVVFLSHSQPRSHHFWEISYGFRLCICTPARTRIPWVHTDTLLFPSSPCTSLFSTALPSRFQLLRCPRLWCLFPYSAGLLCSVQTPAYDATVRKPSPGREPRWLSGSPHELSFSSQLKYCAFYWSIPKSSCLIQLSSSFTVVHCTRTNMLPVKAKIESPPPKHSLRTCNHF